MRVVRGPRISEALLDSPYKIQVVIPVRPVYDTYYVYVRYNLTIFTQANLLL